MTSMAHSRSGLVESLGAACRICVATCTYWASMAFLAFSVANLAPTHATAIGVAILAIKVAEVRSHSCTLDDSLSNEPPALNRVGP